MSYHTDKRHSDCSTHSTSSEASSSSNPSLYEFDNDSESFYEDEESTGEPFIEISDAIFDEVNPDDYLRPYQQNHSPHSPGRSPRYRSPFPAPEPPPDDINPESSSSEHTCRAPGNKFHIFHHRVSEILSSHGIHMHPHRHRAAVVEAARKQEAPPRIPSQVISYSLPAMGMDLITLDAAKNRDDIVHRAEGFEMKLAAQRRP